MPPAEPLLEVRGLTVALGTFRLDAVDLEVRRGGYHVLLGSSGAGKTVLLEAIAGLVRPAAGSIRLVGRDLAGVPIHRRGLGLVYQDQALFPHLSVAGNLGYALPRAQRPTRVRELAALVGVDHLLSRRPATLSGGEAQRVALARALAAEPAMLLLDEPLSALDVRARTPLRALLRRLHAAGTTVLHVTHDFEEAIALADRVSVLDGGVLVQSGTPDEVFHHPKTAFVAQFVGLRNFLPGGLLAGESDDRPFACAAGRLHVASDAPPGPGWLTLRGEDLSLSLSPLPGSARNALAATVKDLEAGERGLEVHLDAGGLELVATITRAAREALALAPGQTVQVSFKATAARFVPGGIEG